MCFNKASSNAKNSTNQNDDRIGADNGAQILRAEDDASIVFENITDEIAGEAFDFLSLSLQGVENFTQSALDAVNGISNNAVAGTASAYQTSQAFANDVISQQNPNDANRIQYIVLAGIAGAVAIYIWGKK